MGALPGYIDESITFTLQEHEDLDIKLSAEKNAAHFAKISQEFPPLCETLLPERVREKASSPESE